MRLDVLLQSKLQNKILKLCAISLISFSLVGCEKLAYEHFNDRIISYRITDDYEVATGIRGTFYITAGEMHLKGDNVVAGTAVAFDHRFHYPIIELLKKYPEYRDDRTIKAAAIQAEIWRNHPPEIQRRID